MKARLFFVPIILFLAAMLASTAGADVPEIISYQGILTNSNDNPLNGNYDITLNIYDTATGGTALWSETHTGVPVSGGVFHVMLGSVNAFPESLDFSVPYWLGVSINGGDELTPRTEFASVGTAFMAKNVMDEAITQQKTKNNSLCPPGMVAPFATAAPPDGWLACNGQAVSRTTYADLFAAIGTMYGAGDGSTTFNLPDYRGYFLRGLDNGAGIDTEAVNRTDRGDGTTGDNIGTKQLDQANNLEELATVKSDGGAGTYNPCPVPNDGSWSNYGTTGYSGGTKIQIRMRHGGIETRPKNIYVLYCIKY